MYNKQLFRGAYAGRTRLFIIISVVLLIFFSWLEILDWFSANYVDGALIQASVAFAVARTLNAVISVLKSIEVSAAIASIGPGQALDPIDNMIEQFASLMQMAVASLILQKILLAIVSEAYFKLAITLAGIGLITSIFLNSNRFTATMLKVFVFMVFLRFSIVLVVMLNGVADHVFLAEQTRQDVKILNELPGSIDMLNQADSNAAVSEEALRELQEAANAEFDAKEDSLISAREHLNEEIAALDIELAQAKQELEDITSHMGTVQRFNPLNRSEEHSLALSRVEQAKEQLSAKRREQESVQRQFNALEREREAMANAGNETGFWSSISRGASGLTGTLAKLTDMNTYRGISHTFDNMVETIITVMVLFVLKTMLLPILFMLAFIKICKSVWGIDLSGLLSRVKTDQQKEQKEHPQNA